MGLQVRRHWRRWAVGGAAAVVVLGVGGPFLYIHVIEGTPPSTLSLSGSASSSGGPALTAAQIDGRWTVTSGSTAGYRVAEVLAGQHTTAVGRTSDVTGGMTLTGRSISAASFTVDLRTVRSDRSQRDDQFRGRIMDTADHPDAVFTLTRPITLVSLPRSGEVVEVDAVGTLAMHGVTRQVTAALEARDTGSTMQVSGSIPVHFADWSIANPSFGSFVRTGDDGVVELLVNAAKS